MRQWSILVPVLWSMLLMAMSQVALASLPTPEGLETDVRFWEGIFSQYSPEQCVFHDKSDLTVIYVVKRIPGGNPVAESRNIRRYVGAIRASLLHLADGGEPRNLLERRIVSVIPAPRRSPSEYRRAVENVRCQRGVDLGPSFARSRQHLEMVKRVLTKKGLPDDLAHLPHLESGYHVTARSKAGARGLWQLMPATARLQGLSVNRRIDQRVEPMKATFAAAKILKELYATTRSWPLAITAYNYGPNGMVRAIRQWGSDYMTIRENHRTRIFGFAARNYYPSFLAVRNVAEGREGGADDGGPIAINPRPQTPRSTRSM